MGLAAQPAKNVGRLLSGGDFIQPLPIEIEHLVTPEHDARMRDGHFQRLGFSEQIRLLRDAGAFGAERVFQRLLVNARADLLELQPCPAQYGCTRLAF